MRKCVDSLLVGGEDVEIIIVNDGSRDGTAGIAEEYADKYPTIVKAVHQETEVMAPQSILVSGMRKGCILKWWTAMTG